MKINYQVEFTKHDLPSQHQECAAQLRCVPTTQTSTLLNLDDVGQFVYTTCIFLMQCAVSVYYA